MHVPIFCRPPLTPPPAPPSSPAGACDAIGPWIENEADRRLRGGVTRAAVPGAHNSLPIRAAAVAPSGRFLASVGDDGFGRLFSGTGAALARFGGHSGPVVAVAVGGGLGDLPLLVVTGAAGRGRGS